jgi:hypothetical protein
MEVNPEGPGALRAHPSSRSRHAPLAVNLRRQEQRASGLEFCLQDAGAAVVIANSIALAKSALDEGIPSMRRLLIYAERMEMPAP